MVPGSSDVVCFKSGVTTVIYNASVSVEDIEGSGVALQVLGGTLNVTDVTAGNTSTLGSLEVTGGSIGFAGTATIPAVTVDGGTLVGAGTITATTLGWTSGNISGSGGAITVSGATTITLGESGATSNLSQFTIEANGGATFSGSPIDAGFTFGYQGTIDLGGTSSITGSYFMGDSGSATGLTVESTATLNDTGASGSTVTVNVPLTNSGTVSVPAGATFDASGGGTSTGAFNTAAGSTLYVNDVTLSAAGTVNGAGGDAGSAVVEVANNSTIEGTITAGTLENGGGSTSTFSNSIDVGALTMTYSTFNFNGTGTFTVTGAVTLNGGDLGGSGNITAGTMAWSEGDIGTGGGSITVAGATTITTGTGANAPYIEEYTLNATDGATFTTAGITDPGVYESYQGSIILAGTSTISGTYYFGNDGSATGITVSRGATLSDTGASGSTVTVNVPLTNSGTVSVPAGATFDASGGGTSTGAFNTAAGSTLYVNDVTLSAAATVNGAGGDAGSAVVEVANNSTIEGTITAGTLENGGGSTSTFSNSIDVGALTMTYSTFNFNGTGTFTVTGAVTLNGGDLGGSGNLTAGTMAWSEGDIGTGGGSITVAGATTITTGTGANAPYIEEYTLNATDGATFTTAGITDPGVYESYQGSIILAGTSTISGTYYFGNDGSATGITVSRGATLSDTGASGSTVTVNVPLTNSGTVSVPAGATFDASGGGTSTGAFNTAAGSTLYVNDVTLSAAGTVNGAGGDAGSAVVEVANNSTIEGTITAGTLENGGGSTSTFSNSIDVGALTMTYSTFNFNGTGTFTVTGAVTLNGGDLGGSGNLTAGTMAWSEGDIGTGGGSITVAGATTITTGTGANAPYIEEYTLNATDGATFTTAGITDPGVYESYQGSIILAGTSTISGTYYFGNDGSATGITVSRGATLSDTGASGSTVTVNVPLTNSGTVSVPAGATFDASGGGTSTGAFNTAAGSTLYVNDVTLSAAATVNGAGGDAGSAVVEVANNSTIEGTITAGTLENGGGSTSTFSNSIDVGALTMTYSTFNFNGTGTFTVTGAVTLNGGDLGGSGNITAGTMAWSEGDINGSSGSITVAGATTISTSTAAATWYIEEYTINATDGATFPATVSDPGLTLAYDSTINLAGSSTIPANEIITSNGGATGLIVQSGGTLSVGGTSGTTEIAAPFSSDGAVTVPSGALDYFTSTYSQSGGSTTLAAASSELIAPTVAVTGGTLEGDGTVAAAVSNTAGTVQAGIGKTPGTLTIVGTYTQSTGATLVANLAGATPGTGYGQLNVTNASLNGTLDVNDQKSFAPTSSDTFNVVVAESAVSGTFSTVTQTGFSVAPNVTYTTTEVQLTFATTITPTITVHSTSATAVYGQPVTLTATVTGGGPVATGTVQFMVGTSKLGSVQTLSNGVATLANAPLPVGTLSITAVYSGDSNYKPGTSPKFTEKVSQVATTFLLQPSPSLTGAGQTVTLNAIVTEKSPSVAFPTGSVTFYNGTKKIGTATLSSGVASVKTSFAAGKYSLKATYPGNTDFKSSSGTATETVVSTGSKTSITESATRVLTAVDVKFTATVKPDSGSGVATGDVQFFNGVATLGKPVKLSSKGVATASYAFAHGGTFQITAEYLGTKTLGGSTSSAVTLVAQEPGYRLVGQDGGVFDFGGAGYYGSLPNSSIVPKTPVVGMASTPDGLGYWLVTQGAVVYPFGDAKKYSAGQSGTPPSIVAIVPTADGQGYWLVGDNGTVWRYGDAASYGQKTGVKGVIGAAGTPDGKGYWIATNKGKVYPFGDAKSYPAAKGQSKISGTISSIAATIDGKGYYLVNTSGVVYAFGDAKSYGNAKNPSASIVGIAVSPRGTGYWLAGADGSVYNLGSAPADGSVSGAQLTAPICGTSSFP